MSLKKYRYGLEFQETDAAVFAVSAVAAVVREIDGVAAKHASALLAFAAAPSVAACSDSYLDDSAFGESECAFSLATACTTATAVPAASVVDTTDVAATATESAVTAIAAVGGTAVFAISTASAVATRRSATPAARDLPTPASRCSECVSSSAAGTRVFEGCASTRFARFRSPCFLA